MNKNSVIAIIIAAVITVSLAVIGLLLLIPQMVPVSEETKEYKNIKESEFTYEPIKNIQEEPEIQQYVITTENISEGKAAKAYVAGKTNPFASSDTTANTSGESSGQNNNSNSSGTQTPTSGETPSGTTQTPISASDK